MNHMVEDPQNANGAEQGDDEYPVLPPEPVEVKCKPWFRAVDINELLDTGESEEEKPPLQFSLAELMGVITAAAVALGIICSLPLGSGLRVMAGIAGVGLFVSLIVLDYLQLKRRIVYIAWWTAFVSYILICLLAGLATS
jgi:hypothetical protein